MFSGAVHVHVPCVVFRPSLSMKTKDITGTVRCGINDSCD